MFSFVALVMGLIYSSTTIAGGTVCVFNKAGRSLPVTIEWDGGCKDSVDRINDNSRMKYTCNDTKKATLKLKWKGYKAEYYKFPGMGFENKCNDSNSLTIDPTDFGYKWNVFKGKGF